MLAGDFHRVTTDNGPTGAAQDRGTFAIAFAGDTPVAVVGVVASSRETVVIPWDRVRELSREQEETE